MGVGARKAFQEKAFRPRAEVSLPGQQEVEWEREPQAEEV